MALLTQVLPEISVPSIMAGGIMMEEDWRRHF